MESDVQYPFLKAKTLENIRLNKLKDPLEIDPLFWKKRTLQTFLKAPYFISVSFIPSTLSSYTILFLQKVGGDPVGFYCPYLNEEETAKWKASSQVLRLKIITDLQSIDSSLDGIDATIYKQMKECLGYFLSDTSTSGLVLTFRGPQGTPESRFWSKKLSTN